eukprot:TRINITY_DN23446_c0_g1_i1.p1 TRINITY_DN23446_c0_g1~~TRINITY_DN23446_c0_g1_i1.p1  ORF type:complete len:491 (-),score=127.70 TRINITY_DN23446_c0_g1_i1:235-1707(-)
MADNAGSAVISLNAAATVINSADGRQDAGQRLRKWAHYLRKFSCFGAQKRTKRIVPASRIPEGNANGNRGNGAQQPGAAIQPTGLAPSLLAPPSSPASFTNSGNPSSAQSPTGLFSLSANVCSPGGPTSTMFATGPYAHETQLVSPPVFSTFTTEPSTAPFTPPPELAHLTTPSSPDVPFAQLLASSLDVKTDSNENGVTFSSSYTSSGFVCANDLQAAYQLQPGSPASQTVSPKPGVSSGGSSLSFPDLQFRANWNSSWSGKDSFSPKHDSSKAFTLDPSGSRTITLSQGSTPSSISPSPELDHLQHPCHSVGKQHISSPEYDTAWHVQQNRHNDTNKPDVEQLEAYRASFGFSADEVTASNSALYGESGKRHQPSETETTELVFFNSANLSSPRDDGFLHDMDAEDMNDYAKDRNSGGSEAGFGRNNEASSLKCSDFKFDKHGNSSSGTIIEKWARYKEKQMAQNNLMDQSDFHLIHPQEYLNGVKLS